MRSAWLFLLYSMTVYAFVKFDPSGKPVDQNRKERRSTELPVFNTDVQFNLLVPYYDNPERVDEIAFTIKKNVAHPLIKKICVFYETKSHEIPAFLKDPKIEVVFIDHVPTHKDFYDFANVRFSGEIVIMANADIFFDKTLKFVKYVDFSKCSLALSRYRYKDLGQFTVEHGQDCWIFKTPKKYVSGDYKIGRFNTEYGFVRECLLAGLLVVNPCLTIKTWHVHACGTRILPHYTDENLAAQAYFDTPFMTLTEAIATVNDVFNNYSRQAIIAFGAGTGNATFANVFKRTGSGVFFAGLKQILAKIGDHPYP